MKKLILVITLIFAVSLSSNAQEMKAATKSEKKAEINPQVEAKLDAVKLSEYLSLDGTITEDLFRLFEMKYKTLQNELTPERKVELARVIEAKIRATVGDELMAKLEKNQELFKKLVN